MIHPDQRPEPSRRKSGAGAIAAALIAVVVGGVALIAWTSPDPEAAQTTTSASTTTTTTLDEIEPPIDLENFSVEQISRGEPFQWEQALSVIEGFPLGLVKHQGALYLFAINVPNFSAFDVGGLQAWRSRDGLAWEALGQVIDETYRVGSVTSTGENLVAVSDDPNSPALTVWQSQDGTDWSSEQVPLEAANEFMAVYPYAVGGTSDILVISGLVNLDMTAFMKAKLGDAADYEWGADVYPDHVKLILHGPYGSPLAVISADEFGLNEERREAVIEAIAAERQGAADIWTRVDSEWQQTVIPEAHSVESITATPDGQVVANGWGPGGLSSWSTSDGFQWEEVDAQTYRPNLVGTWGERLVASNPSGGVSVYVSSDGQEWEEMGPDDAFPDEIQWWTGAIAAGPPGVALGINGWDESQPFATPSSPSPPTLTDEDGTLTIDFNSNRYRLETGRDSFSWRMGTQAGVEADLEASTIRFIDPETDEVLAEFPIEDIFEAERSFFQPRGSEGDQARHDALAFTSDGSEWTIQPMVASGSGYFVNLLAVTDTHLVATAVGGGGFFDPSSPPGFKVWTTESP